MIKQSIHLKDRITENIYTLNIGESKQIKQILTGVRIPDHLTYLLGIPEHLTCLLRNLYAWQEATLRTGHGTIDWFKIGKGLYQACILSPWLFNLYSECMLSHFSHVWFCDPTGCIPPDSSVHGMLQQEYCDELPSPSPESLPNQGSNPHL